MNFFEKQLRQIFDGCEGITEQKYNGKTMLAKIDEDLRVKASFVTTGISGNYNAIRLRIINRTEGEVDVQTFHFRDIFNNTPTARTAYICDDCGETRWYNYAPGASDITRLTNQLVGYISMYQADGMEMSGQSM